MCLGFLVACNLFLFSSVIGFVAIWFWISSKPDLPRVFKWAILSFSTFSFSNSCFYIVIPKSLFSAQRPLENKEKKKRHNDTCHKPRPSNAVIKTKQKASERFIFFITHNRLNSQATPKEHYSNATEEEDNSNDGRSRFAPLP